MEFKLLIATLLVETCLLIMRNQVSSFLYEQTVQHAADVPIRRERINWLVPSVLLTLLYTGLLIGILFTRIWWFAIIIFGLSVITSRFMNKAETLQEIKDIALFDNLISILITFIAMIILKEIS